MYFEKVLTQCCIVSLFMLQSFNHLYLTSASFQNRLANADFKICLQWWVILRLPIVNAECPAGWYWSQCYFYFVVPLRGTILTPVFSSGCSVYCPARWWGWSVSVAGAWHQQSSFIGSCLWKSWWCSVCATVAQQNIYICALKPPWRGWRVDFRVNMWQFKQNPTIDSYYFGPA